MAENVIPTSYNIRCRNCKHPAKFHDKDHCVVKGCKCKIFEAEELDHKHAIDQLTGKEICHECMSFDDLENGTCKRCKIFKVHYDKLKEKNPNWNNRKLRDTAEKLTKKEIKQK